MKAGYTPLMRANNIMNMDTINRLLNCEQIDVNAQTMVSENGWDGISIFFYFLNTLLL